MKTHETSSTRNVLVAVDVQNDFVNGSLAVAGGEQVIDPINQLAEATRASVGRVAFTRDWHPATTPHFDAWPVHCVAGTDGAEFHPELNIEPADVILSKGMGQTDGYSGMEGVSDDGQTIDTFVAPQENEKVRVFIGGLATDYCVKATAIGAADRFAAFPNVEIHAISDAMRAVNIQPNDGIDAIAEMAAAGVHITSLADALELIDANRLER